MRGPMKLWNCCKSEWMQLSFHNRVHIPDSYNLSAGWIGTMAGNIDILPAHASRYDSQWLPSDLVMLIHHQEIRRPLLRSQRLLSMLYRPFQFFHSDQDLSERSVDSCLPRVEACHGRYSLLIVKDVPASRIESSITYPFLDSYMPNVLQQRLQHPSPLPERSVCPFPLCLCSFGYCPIDSIRSGWVHVSE